MAALIDEELGQGTRLEPGDRGELTIWVDGTRVAGKGPEGFPADADLLGAVRSALALGRLNTQTETPTLFRRDDAVAVGLRFPRARCR